MDHVFRHPKILILLSFSLIFCVSCDQPAPRETGVENSGNITIGVVGRTNNDSWKGIAYGIDHAADDYGLQLTFAETVVSDDGTLQKQAIDGFISQRVSGIIVAPNNRFELRDAIKNAIHRGIFVVLLDTEPSLMFSEKDGKNPMLVSTDQFAAGCLAANYLATQLGEKGRIAVIRYSSMSPTTEEREKGFLSQIKEYPEITLVHEDVFIGTTPAVARDKLRTFLQIYCPDGQANIDGIFISNESTACELLDQMKRAKMDKKICLVAFGKDSRLKTGMLTYLVDALVVEQPVKMGELAVKTMADLIRGEESATPTIDSGVYLITADNLMAPYTQALLRFPADETLETLISGPPTNPTEEPLADVEE